MSRQGASEDLKDLIFFSEEIPCLQCIYKRTCFHSKYRQILTRVPTGPVKSILYEQSPEDMFNPTVFYHDPFEQ